jgi:hypothetical protein
MERLFLILPAFGRFLFRWTCATLLRRLIVSGCGKLLATAQDFEMDGEYKKK